MTATEALEIQPGFLVIYRQKIAVCALTFLFGEMIVRGKGIEIIALAVFAKKDARFRLPVRKEPFLVLFGTSPSLKSIFSP